VIALITLTLMSHAADRASTFPEIDYLGGRIRIAPDSPTDSPRAGATRITGSMPPSSWLGSFPPPIPMPDSPPTYVGRIGETNLYLFFFQAAVAPPQECRVLFEEALVNIKGGAAVVASACSNVDEDALFVNHSGGSSTSAVVWGPLDSRVDVVRFVVAGEDYWAVPRGGYVVVAGIELPQGDSILATGFDRGNRVIAERDIQDGGPREVRGD